MSRAERSAAPAQPPTTGAAETRAESRPAAASAAQVAALRDVFWNNVVRDMLNGLAVLCQQQPELFDGRFSVLTHGGERIPIAQVFPIFACSIPGAGPDHDASVAVQCTVFRILTPGGEVFTLPVHEVRAMHSMTPELIQRLQTAAEDDEIEQEGPATTGPFGLAAFTSLPKGPPQPAPNHPME